MGQARTAAKFPEVPPGKAHYESFYLKAADPRGGRAVWLRHTVHQRPGEARTASLWLTLFADGAPVALKVTETAERLSVPAGGYIQVGDASFTPGQAVGKMSADGRDAAWDLRFTDGDETLWHLPAALLYKAPLPKTKALSPHPHSLWSGTIRLGDVEFTLDAWPGMVGHNWGTEHAERWIWLHGDPFREGGADAGGAWLDLTFGRLKIGSWLTPWVGNGMLTLDGKRHRLGGIPAARQTEVTERPTSLEFSLPGKGIQVRGRVVEPDGAAVGWAYADPDGSWHNAVNCSRATLELEVREAGRPKRTLICDGAAAYELGMRETDHGIPLQPWTDGR